MAAAEAAGQNEGQPIVDGTPGLSNGEGYGTIDAVSNTNSNVPLAVTPEAGDAIGQAGGGAGNNEVGGEAEALEKDRFMGGYPKQQA